MKTLGTIIFVFLLLVGSTINSFGGETWLKTPIADLQTALQDPGKSISLSLKCESREIDQFLKNVQRFTSLENLVLRGKINEKRADELFSALSKIETLSYVEFNSNGFEHVPSSINELKTVKTLAFSDNDKLDLEEMVERISDLEKLQELKLEIYSVKDMPENIADLEDIDKVSIFNKEVIFGNEGTKQNAEEQLKTISEFKLTRKPDGQTEQELNVTYVSIGQSISGNEMNALAAFFPNAFVNEKYEDTFMENATLKMITAQVWNKKYEFIKPPIKNVDVDRTWYELDPSNGGDFTYNTGTHVSIPPYAFVNSDGSPVNKPVTIAYREFRDQADILASGIPMTYDSGGVMNNFESAGMFEITAFAGGKEVFLKGDKKIDLDFSSVDDRSSFNLYAFNDSSGNWDLLGKAGKIRKFDPETPKILSSAYLTYRLYLNYTNIRAYDSTTFNERYASDKYWYTSRKPGLTKSKKMKLRIGKTARTYMLKSWLVKTVPARTTKDGQVIFGLKYFSAMLPELNQFANFNWITTENISMQAFRKQFGSKNRFNDIRIRENGEDYIMELKNLDGKVSIHVKPIIYTADKKINNIKDNGKNNFKRYSRILRSRQHMFDRMVRHGKMKDNIYNVNTIEEKKHFAWLQTRRVMTAEEREMPFDKWIEYYDAVTKDELNAVNNSGISEENIMRSFSIDGMGVYNCDQVSRMLDPITVNARYIDGEMKKMNPSVTFVVDKSMNGVFRYGGDWSFEGGSNKISFDGHSENVMVTVENGDAAVFTPEQFKNEKIENGTKHEFKMNRSAARISSVGELRDLMGLK